MKAKHFLGTFWGNCFGNRRRSFSGAYLDPSVQILGEKSVHIAEGAVIGENCWLNVNSCEGENRTISIGRFTFVGRRAFFTCGSSISVGPYCVLGPDCHFVGAAHIFSNPFMPYLVTGVTNSGTIRIGANCFLGARSTFLADCEVGYGSIIGASAVVRGTIPPLSMVVGNPARIVKSFDSVLGRWVDVGTCSQESKLPSEEEYIAILATLDWKCRRYSKGARIAASGSLGSI